jgi:hypothetical protein
MHPSALVFGGWGGGSRLVFLLLYFPALLVQSSLTVTRGRAFFPLVDMTEALSIHTTDHNNEP